MSTKSWLLAGAVLFLFGPILMSPSVPASADDVERVMITNFPSVQIVDGTMAIGSPIPSTHLLEVSTVVSPADPRDLHEYTDAGVVDLSGFSEAVLSLGGEIKGTSSGESLVGVVLIPDESRVEDAFLNHQEILFPLTVEAEVGRLSGGIFGSPQEAVRLAFPRYRVFLYNSGRSSVSATLYIYLST
jgi:hypothetical protein